MSDGEKAEIVAYGESVVIAEMPFVAVVDRRDLMRPPGEFPRKQPKLFVVCYSPAQDTTTMRSVEWEVAETLAPAAFSQFIKRLQEARPNKPQDAPPRECAA